MQLNYFGALRVTLGLLPAMQQKKAGHVINISSIGVLANAPRFAAYVASKAAMDAFARCAASEFADDGIAFTTINMPLVRTGMTAPTKVYDQSEMLTPEEAADLIVHAIIEKPDRIATRLGIFAQVLHAMAPKVSNIIMNTAYRLFPESAAAMGRKEGREPETVARAGRVCSTHPRLSRLTWRASRASLYICPDPVSSASSPRARRSRPAAKSRPTADRPSGSTWGLRPGAARAAHHSGAAPPTISCHSVLTPRRWS